MRDTYFHVGRTAPAKGVHSTADGPTILWLTVCAKDRGTWIAQQAVMDRLQNIWANNAKAWLVGDFLLMPDHVHFFCAPSDLRFSVERWIAYWKECFTKSHDEKSWNWQRNGFHHRIRSADEYHDKWIYMMENPLRKGLVKKVEDWPWKGKVHDIRW